MFQVCERIKNCRVASLKLKETHHMNSGKAIAKKERKLLAMQEAGGERDWLKWNGLPNQLGVKHKRKETYWHKKSRIQ